MHFRVAIGEYHPFLKLKTQDGIIHMSGPLAEAFDLLAHKVNFTYTLYRDAHDTWGIKGPNGWTGLLGMLSRNEVDLALGPFTLTNSRWSAFELSVPMYVDTVEILAPTFEWNMSLFNMLTVFSYDVWFLIFSSVIVLCFLVGYIESYQNPHTKFKQGLARSIWDVTSTLLQKGKLQRPQGYSLTILNVIWMLSALVISHVFGGMILTNLLLRKVQMIDSIEDLEASEIVQPIIEYQSSVYGAFRLLRGFASWVECVKITVCFMLRFVFMYLVVASCHWNSWKVNQNKLERFRENLLRIRCWRDGEPEVYRSIFSKVNRNPDQCIINYKNMSTIGMEYVWKGSHALITDGMGLRHFLSKRVSDGLPCNYKLARQPLWPLWKVLAFGENFPKNWISKINQILRYISESGWLQTMMIKEFSGFSECLSVGTIEVQSLKLEHVLGTFIIWLLGCLASFIVFAFELCFRDSKKKIKHVSRRRHGHMRRIKKSESLLEMMQSKTMKLTTNLMSFLGIK